jgi:choline dehydrogenase-like flavoprotein
LGTTEIQSSVYQLGPDLRFTRDAHSEARALDNVQCLLNATVTGIDANPQISRDGGGQKVTRLTARTLAGSSLDLAATVYVLAAGAIENARLLLVNEIGNRYDQVGRCYMDHPAQVFTEFVPADRSLFNRSAFYDRRAFRGTEVLGRLVLSPAALEREKILNVGVYLFPRPSLYRWLPVEAVKQLKVSIRDRSFKPELFGQAFHAAAGLPWIVAYARRRARGQRYATQGWSRWPDNAAEYHAFHPTFNLEQSPDPANRVTLGPGRDALGMPQPILHWRWRDLDRRSAWRAAKIIDSAFRAAGLGRWRPLATSEFGPCNHHSSGTTRMSDDPRHGVVDAIRKVHGMDNLFVTGASVFPTSGYQNPMLTIIAISLRLADHLTRTLSPGCSKLLKHVALS